MQSALYFVTPPLTGDVHLFLRSTLKNVSAEFSQGGAVVDPGICKGVADLNLSGAATEDDPMILKVGEKMSRAKRAKKNFYSAY